MLHSQPSGSNMVVSPSVRPPAKLFDIEFAERLPEQCQVCGDIATGFHYDVASCNGCRTFFRRTILTQRRFCCRNGGRCFTAMSKTARCQCRACRFRKCIEVGMNPQGIKCEQQDLLANDMYRAVVEKRKQLQDEQQVQIVDALIPRRLLNKDEGIEHLIEGLLHLEIKHDKLRKSTYNPKANPGLTIAVLLQSNTVIGSELQEMPNWPMSWPEGEKTISVKECINNRIVIPTRDYEGLPFNYKFWTFCDVIYAVEYVRALDFFRQLDLSDQITLVKNVVMQCNNVTTSFFSYTHKCDLKLFPDGRMKGRHEKQSDVIGEMIELQMDKTEYVLLKALLHCNPAWEGLSVRAQAAMTPLRDRIASALMQYCLVRRGAEQGPSAFTAMLGMIGRVHHQTKHIKELLMLLWVMQLLRYDCKLLAEISQ